MTGLYYLSGFIPYSDSDISFGQPIFKVGERSESYIQMPDHRSQNIHKFVLSEVDEKDVHPINGTSLETSAGRMLIFVAVNKGTVCIGNLMQIRSTLQNWAELQYSGPGFRLQVSELYNVGSQKKGPRKNVIERVSAEVPNSLASKFFATSLLLNSIWDSLQKNVAPDKAMMLWESRRDVNARLALGSDHLFATNVEDWFRAKFDLNIYDIEREVKTAFPIEMLDNSLSSFFESAETDTQIDDYITQEIELISQSSRQEARVAKLIRRLMESPGKAIKILEQYEDRAAFANRAVRFLRSHSEEFLFPPRVRFAQHLIDRLYRYSYPKQRGIMLHELAVALGEYHEYNEAIRKKTEWSVSEPVSIARGVIYDQLDNPGERRGLVRAPAYEWSYGMSVSTVSPYKNPKN